MMRVMLLVSRGWWRSPSLSSFTMIISPILTPTPLLSGPTALVLTPVMIHSLLLIVRVVNFLFPSFLYQYLFRCLLQCASSVWIPKFRHWLWKIDVNSSFINQNIVHALVRIDTWCLRLIFNESVLQRVTSFPVTDHITTLNGPETRKYKFQVVVLRHRVHLAHE